MRAIRQLLAAGIALSFALAMPAARAAAEPRTVLLISPAGPGIAAIRSECPTFNWSALPEAEKYRLVVYDASDGSAQRGRSTPVLEMTLPAGASGFTPTAERCLTGGKSYGWAVAALVDGGERWSEPALFRVLPEREAEPRQPRIVDGGGTARTLLPSGSAVSAGPADAPGLRDLHGEVFSPPACTSHFNDVGPSNAFCPWIEQLWRDEITGDEGCGGGNYCPKAPVTREQLALLLERSMRGTDTFRPGSTTADIPNRTPASATITPLQSAGDVGKYSSITIGADGLGLISYWDTSFGTLRVAHCSNVDCTAATITAVDFAPFFTYYTSITIGADGFGLISYYDALYLDLKVAHCANVECTAVDAVTPIDTTGDVGQYTSITIGADGLGLISYYDATNQHLKVAHCANVECTAADQITPLDTENVGVYTSIAIGADGLGLISYEGSILPDLKVAHCSNTACTAATITPVDAASEVSPITGTSVTIGADTLGLISYTDEFNRLKVAHCQDTNCTGAPFIQIDSGQFSSITIGADGLGLISYYDPFNGILKIAHCSNTNCTVARPTSLDTAGNVGQYTSITLGADGLGLISYYDATNGDLKVAHCSNVLCAPYFRRR